MAFTNRYRRKIPDLLYHPGIISHAALIWGIWIFANHACRNKCTQNMPTIFARISCAVWLFTCVYRHAQTAVEVGSLMNKNIVLTSSISCLYLRSFIRYQSPCLTLSFIQIDNIFSRVLVFGKCTACSFWWSLHSEFSLTFYMF